MVFSEKYTNLCRAFFLEKLVIVLIALFNNNHTSAEKLVLASDNWREQLIPELKRGIIIEVGGHKYQNFNAGKDLWRNNEVGVFIIRSKVL